MDSVERSSSPKRVVFIGGLADGRLIVQELLGHPGVDLVRVYVLEDDSGHAVSGFCTFDDLVAPPVLRKIKRIGLCREEIAAIEPDLIVVAGFSQIIPQGILDVPPLGTIGFHSAVLPGRRGCSPIIWAIVDGLTESGVTMFYMAAGIDAGDVIDVERFEILASDQAAQVLDKADQATLALFRRHLDQILDGTAPRVKHDLARSSYTRKRTFADGEIDWSRPAVDVYNLIRALSPPYPMAHAYAGDGTPLLIERAHILSAEGLRKIPPPRFLPNDPMRQRVLCVVAHPDDEVLGVGGTLALHAEAGSEVIVLILSEGESAQYPNGIQGAPSRDECARACGKELGVTTVLLERFPDMRLDTIPLIDIVHCIEQVIARYKPTVVYTHHGGDANSDHLVTFRATYAACRPMTPSGRLVKRLLTFETPSSTDQAPQTGSHLFTPATFVDIEPVWKKKLAALACYPTEMVGGIHPRSYEYIEALARMRGGYAGYRFAEAFVSVRERLGRPAAAYHPQHGEE